METNKSKKQPQPIAVVNGKKQYRLSTADIRCIADCHPSHAAAAVFRKTAGPATPPAANAADPPPAEGPAEEPESQASADPGEVRKLVRVLSAVLTWSNMGWLGPQLVDNGHNGAYALRKMAGFITMRQQGRSVPLVWDHSFSMRDKAGRLEKGAWEDSTDIEPGVNSDAVVRRNYDPQAANGLEGGEIDAMSVAWDPVFEQSHPDMDFWAFAEMQGHEVDGKIVRWLPVDLTEDGVLHLGMVWAGADEYAGLRSLENVSAQNQVAAGVPAGRMEIASQERGTGIMDKLIAFCQAVLNAIGIEHILDENGTVPESLNERVMGKLKNLVDLRGLYNELAQGLQTQEPHFLMEGETKLSLNQIVERLPGRLELARAGEQYIADLRAEATRLFDVAKTDPAKPEMSNEAKQIREVIANCESIPQLKAYAAEYAAQAEARFGKPVGRRTSNAEEPPGSGAENQRTPEERRLEASMKRYETGGRG